MSTYLVEDFPKPILTFGNIYTEDSIEKVQKGVSTLSKLCETLPLAMEHSADLVVGLAAAVPFAGSFLAVITILQEMTGEVNELGKELKGIEFNIVKTEVSGKMHALNHHLNNLKDDDTSMQQKVSEIVTAISIMDALLPSFAEKGNIFFDQCYVGAPLFVPICGILKAICMIADATPGYNRKCLANTKMEYQAVLQRYKMECIGKRIASCYVKRMMVPAFVSWGYDQKSLNKTYSKYYTDATLAEKNSYESWESQSENFGGEGWRIWSGSWYCSLVDTWDKRAKDEVEKTSITFKQRDDGKYHKDIIDEYRRQLEGVMLEFFDEVDLTEYL